MFGLNAPYFAATGAASSSSSVGSTYVAYSYMAWKNMPVAIKQQIKIMGKAPDPKRPDCNLPFREATSFASKAPLYPYE